MRSTLQLLITKGMRFLALTAMAVLSMTVLGCGTTPSDEVPDEFELPAGVEVVSIELDEDDEGDLPSSGRKGFSVTVTLSGSLPSGSAVIIPYIVRDVELIGGRALCAGFVGMSAADGVSATRTDSFFMECVDGEVVGRASSDLWDMDELDDSSGEGSTRIYAQHYVGLKTFLGWTTGVEGVKSNKIRVSCP